MHGVRFWGTRGSLPVALDAAGVRAKLVAALRGANGHTFASDADVDAYVDSLPFDVGSTFGGNTSCVELLTGNPEYVACDLGSGLRPFGQAAIARHGPAAPQTYHLFVSHVHWDHIMGLPFFGPAYIPGNRLVFYGGHENLEAALRRQMDPPSFPVSFDVFRAAIDFVRLAPDVPHDVAGVRVTLKHQHHAGDSYGYRFEKGGRTIVYSTDSEHQLTEPGELVAFTEFFRDADLVIFDAMYSLAEATSVKADWGHSSNIVGVELCQAAKVKELCLFHHEPALDDAALTKMLTETRRFEEITRRAAPLRISAAYDGLEIRL
ncbi:MAG TPA: MBL fold metallo-hydrolase [Casimicrobiaceae bacterium]|nr:MBL fold metallo-hydrolase [Casimicrobiaceae bacterium]